MTTKIIELNFNDNWSHAINFKHEKREFEGVRIKSWKNRTITMTATKGNIPYCTIQKRWNIDETNNTFYVTFGKQILTLGTYKEMN